MQERHKRLLRTIVGELRRTLAGMENENGQWMRGDLDRELERLGIAPDGKISPPDAVNPTRLELRAYQVAESQLKLLKPEERRDARHELVERAAYTWINRLLALRAMEARGLIDETLRANSEYEGLSEANYILRMTFPAATGAADAGWWTVMEQACTTQAKALPGLFDLNDPSAALRPSISALLAAIKLVGGVPNGFSREEADAAFADPDAIGWAYQFYQEAAKARTYAKLGSGGKASSRAEIAAITQLFTEPYMVQWLLQNSLGRSYHEIYPESQLPKSWPYYISQNENTVAKNTENLSLSTLSVLDPCVGSGHFLREAFDMLVAMYREQFPQLNAAQIADNILERHLHGIDLDPRAAQLAALTLYLRAWDLVRDEQRRERQRTPVNYQPPAMHIATTPGGIGAGALERHLRRHPQDRILKPMLAGIFESLEQADRLGSLLQPRESLDRALVALQGNYTIPMDEDEEDSKLRLSIIETAKRDPEGLRTMLMARVAASFREEAGDTEDVAAALFGREAGEGVKLLQLLERRYAIVVTNPPYMGSKNMDNVLRKFVEQHYKAGKHDLYTAFMIRCLDLCSPGGKVAMITMQGWMFLRTFTAIRAITDTRTNDKNKIAEFSGFLRETTIEALTHLGRYAFSEIGNAVVAPLMFVVKYLKPNANNYIWACRLVAPRPSLEQASLLLKAVRENTSSGIVFYPNQLDLLAIPESPIVYWLRPKFFELLQSSKRLRNIAEVKQGLATADNNRFMRCFWEVNKFGEVKANKALAGRWFWYAKGGRYQKWFGLRWLIVDWEEDGQRLKSKIDEKTGRPYSNVWMLPDTIQRFFFQSGLTYTVAARGSMGVRELSQTIFGHKSYGGLQSQDSQLR